MSVRPVHSRSVAVLTAVIGLTSIAALAAEPAVQLHEYQAAIDARLPGPARAAMARIDEAPRRLLAARAYLRAGKDLGSRWSWSAAEIDAYEKSQEYLDLLRAIAAVQARFEARNPGYSLYVNTRARSLDLQLERWNENPSVGATAQDLERAALRELKLGNYPRAPGAEFVARFAEFLRNWRPPRAAPLAAPGLSLHGRSRAVDFQITKDGRIIAPTETAKVATVWERDGWAAKLAAAVRGSSFVGPLQAPNEPWHYEYVGSKR
jgi:hypothetical protein